MNREPHAPIHVRTLNGGLSRTEKWKYQAFIDITRPGKPSTWYNDDLFSVVYKALQSYPECNAIYWSRDLESEKEEIVRAWNMHMEYT